MDRGLEQVISECVDMNIKTTDEEVVIKNRWRYRLMTSGYYQALPAASTADLGDYPASHDD